MNQKLINYLKKYDNSVVLFSGGIDSTYLILHMIHANVDFVAVTFKSEIIPDRTIRAAVKVAEKLGIKHRIVEYEIPPPVYNNEKNRCYFCKKSMLKNLEGEKYILDGTNYSDLDEERVGLAALREFGVISPLVDLKIKRDEIEEFMMGVDLPYIYNESCLATRFVGIPLNRDIAKKIESVEDYILQKFKLKMLRIRYDGKHYWAEVLEEDLKLADEIEKAAENKGLRLVDVYPYRSLPPVKRNGPS